MTAPESLEGDPCLWQSLFQVKVSADLPHDIETERNCRVARCGLERYFVTLDGNERFAEMEAVAPLERTKTALARLARSVICFEQPLRAAWACGSRSAPSPCRY
jgi:hypothetical protein